MFLFSAILLFNKQITYKIEKVRIDDVPCIVTLGSDKTFAIGDGNKTAFYDKTVTKKSISVPDQLIVNNSQYKLVNISDYAFSNSPFVNVSFPDLMKSKIQYLLVGTHCFEGSSELNEVSFIKSKVRIIPAYCFANCPKLQVVQIGLLTDTFQKYAFYKTGIQQIQIHPHIQTIGKFCFAYSAIEYVEMETTLFPALPTSFFEGCQNLVQVSLPKQLTKLPKRCFYNSGVKKIIFPSTLEMIGDYCFWNCTNLQKVEFNGTMIKELSKNCFEHCTSLAVIYCPKTLTSIADYALSDTGISEFVAPKSLTKVGAGFIQMCKELTDVYMKNLDLPIIPAYSFYRCVNLKKFVPPANMVGVEEFAFSDTKIESFPFATIKKVSRASFAQCPMITEADLSNLESSTIPSELFHLCSSLKTVEWPKGDLRIGSLSFCGTALTSVVFPSLIAIDKGAFSKCVSLEYVDLTHSKVAVYSKEAFSECGDMKITWPTTDIEFKFGKKLFASSKITKLVLPPQCTELSEGCFMRCLDLSSIDLSNTKIKSIPSNCFESAGELEFSWPPTLTVIEEEAFIQCNMRKLIFPESITSIGEKAFFECANIKVIDFTSSKITTIPKECFAHCSALKEIKWSNSIETIEDEAFTSSRIKRLDLPSSITSLGESVFADSLSLLIIDLSNSVLTNIPSKTFSKCQNVRTIMLPKDIKTTAPDAFDFISNCKEIYYPGKSNGNGLMLPVAKMYVSNEYKENKFAGVEVVKTKKFEPEDISLLQMVKDFDEDSNPLNSVPQFEEVHTTRNAVICVIIVVCICVFIWFKCDPYGVNGSEGVELEGELPWYKQIIQKIGFKMEQLQTKTPTFTA